ncbi:endonuclease III [Candidatus Blochmanniella vafra str. BVAF]|uniref:Endonuclease III n=1 Tax=Blochmanniella vafra (strain BVAF) TaxID=859654 RepID=E8Q674_BLOVB|nr:endonuclease III [Candidatus Blochmannia vafer]ADV33768.1 endonuclease III [Candidatus Blochmannia vafer str. BVAF]
MNRIKRYQILCKLRDYNANITTYDTELIYHSPFELLIAVLLSARARDVQVNKVTESLFQVANTPQDMLFLGINRIRYYIRSIGLFNSKAVNIIKICQLLIEKFNGFLPENREELESLPGVGRKTASIILNVIFGWPTIAVDTHVFRFCNRSKFAIGNNVAAVEQKLISVVPREFKKNCHLWLIRHGRNTCHAKKPSCNSCVINSLCEFDMKKFFGF